MVLSVPGSPWWDRVVRLLRDGEEEPGPGPWEQGLQRL